jgi:hypothetical protein
VPLRVYIETTIPSYYYDDRPRSSLRRDVTRLWWDEYRKNFHLCTSETVVAELEAGNHPRKPEKIAIMEPLPRLESVESVLTLTESYIRELVMPREPAADALHLAFATYYHCDVLLTWNCAHLANPLKFEHIRTVNQRLWFLVPLITTPLQLIGVDLDED